VLTLLAAARGAAMANLGGGAEAHARFKQYEYRANSSLVLTTDSRPRDTHEPTGEPETLWGRIDKRSFGDRAVQAKPPELEERLTKSRKKKDRDSSAADAASTPDVDNLPRKRRRRSAAREESVLSLADDVVYRPQTKETRAAYEAMLSVIQQQFGGQPMDVLGGAADEVLTILKNDKIKNPDKKKEIDKLLNPIPTQMFEQFVSIGKLITDFHDASDPASAPSGDGVDATMDDDIGVAVEFEEDDDDEESDFDQVCTRIQTLLCP
jgi:pre-mRNA-splicing helicase BRR2